MKKLVINSTFVLISIFIIYSCVEEFAITTDTSQMESEIVIQGRILAGEESVVYISRTQPFGSKDEPETMPNAKVLIIGQNGYQSNDAMYDEKRNCYLIDTESLSPNTLYALQVEVDDEIYQSHFLSLLDTPEIENVTYKERNDGVSIHVSTKGKEDSSKYYMWSYEEDWEFHALVDFNGIQGIPVYSEKFYPEKYVNGYNPYFYCWKHTDSDNIHIYRTDNLESNLVQEHELIRIPIDDVRISYIYSILVKQCSISEEAYNYYHQLELLTEENFGLFAPMPIELKGNVECVTNPSKNVRGYVLASNIKTKRIFIYESDFQKIHSEYDPICSLRKPDSDSDVWDYVWRQLIANQGAVAITKDGDIHGDEYLSNTLYLRECVDCRSVEGSTKKRPDFWPNNHE